MRRPSKQLICVITVCLFVFGAAACGGGEDDSGQGAPSDVEVDGSDDEKMDTGLDVDPTDDVDSDTPDEDDGGVQPDAPDETDGGVDADTEPDTDEVDSDNDGLSNAEERQLCDGEGSDPYDGDTDGDGLSDYEEVQRGTSPCKKDSDGDGASDRVEIKWGLNPTNPDTYNDGTIDGDRWILSACQDLTPNEIDFYRNSDGNWSVALPTSFENYNDLSITNSAAPLAAAAYGDPTNEVSGFMLSEDNPTSATRPQEPLATQPAGQLFQALRSVATIEQDLTQGDFETHDGYTASTGEYEVSVGGQNGMSVNKLRDELLLEAAPFSMGEVSGLPSSAGARYQNFKVIITVIFRPNLNGPAQRLVTAAVAPLEKVARDGANYSPFVRFRMNDVTNTTNIAEEVDTSLSKCARFTADAERPKTEFYWVLDQSGSMTSFNNTIASFADDFVAKIENTALDYRFGVTNMDPANQGRFRSPAYWHTQSSTFKSEVSGAVTNCGGANWSCDGVEEDGLRVGYEGIRYMTGAGPQQPTPPEEVRSKANIITIFMSDEEANTVKDNEWSDVPGFNSTQDFVGWYQNNTTAFAIVGDGDDCGMDNGQAYKQVALGSGGKSANLCTGDLTQTIEDIIFAASGIGSKYNPKPRPISSSLKVFINGTFVPRAEQDGFNYFAKDNAVAFFGDFRPDPEKADDPTVAPDRVAIVYDTYKDKCKESGNGAFNCANTN